MSNFTNGQGEISFWTRKMVFYFNEVLDVNSDGVVNEVDLETFKYIFRQMKHLPADSPVLERFTNFLNTWFSAIMRADSNSDRSITLQEFLNYCMHVKEQLKGHKTVPDSMGYIRDYIDALFHLLDADGDGLISKHDYIVAYSDFEDPQERNIYWSKICPYNTDNARIDQALFTELCIEFLVSDNENDRGNWIFGLFD